MTNPPNRHWTASDGDADFAIAAQTLPEAREKAEREVRRGDYAEDDGRYVYVDVTLTEVDAHGTAIEDGEDDAITVAIAPREPRCTAGDHEWQTPHAIVGGTRENPGVHASSGGVRIVEACMRCGCARITDTGAQRGDTGETVREVTYQRGRFADEIRNHAKGTP